VARVARVEVLTTARALRGPFDYNLPDELSASVGVGSTVVVPFGRRELVGVVVGLAEASAIAPERLLEPRRATGPGVPAELIELSDWVAREYCSTPARALALMLPPGAGARSRLVARLSAGGRRALEDPGARLGAAQRALLERLRTAGELPAAASGSGHAVLRRLETRGLIELERRIAPRRPSHVAVGVLRGPPAALSPGQREALSAVTGAVAAARHERFLLHGVTGSGKTEIYLQAAAATLERGRGVIVLVPEIGLTPQTVARFTDRFGDTVGVLHSRLSNGERHDEWLRLRRGEARVCIGPRSAVFAPLGELGLVVVDEEHDPSYKHEGDPRYDARRVAEHRAQRAGAVLLAGSATPRPESYVALCRLRLPDRVDGSPLPPVDVLDMRGAAGPLHPRTAEALASCARRGGKAIVLLNRRGWSNFLSCRSCGRVWGCPQCDVALVLHRAEGALSCHHCGHREPVPGRCGDCGSVSVARHGLGTERLEHELAAALGGPSCPVFRLDADVAAGRERAAAVLRSFERAPSGVLVGTQMVGKGHDFDDVELAVVLDADATLRFPDFRSEERTFALIAQLAGRAGRGPRSDGRVLVQTLAPEAPSIAAAARHDSDSFLAAELARRAALGYPPYADLIRIVCSSARDDAAMPAARALRERLEIRDAAVLGPAPLFRLRGRGRAQVVVKAREREAAVAGVGAAVAELAAARAHREVAWSVDVDPA
jgi:primosomal protein N' (replication factor Y)